MPSPAEVREARVKAGLTQSQAAELIDSTERAWRAWESGFRQMPAAKFRLFLSLISKSE